MQISGVGATFQSCLKLLAGTVVLISVFIDFCHFLDPVTFALLSSFCTDEIRNAKS